MIHGNNRKQTEFVKVAVLFDNFGPYHLARLRAAAQVCELLAVEVAAASAEYAWEPRDQRMADGTEWQIVTLLEQGTSRKASAKQLRQRLSRALEDFRPQAVFIPGWSSPAAFIALAWCLQSRVPAVAMSESTAWDERRVGWKEQIKKKFLKLCSAALAGGQAHREYLGQLGLPPERVFLGYDAVDNDYFAAQSAARSQRSASSQPHDLPAKYFLASNRFIAKKNLFRLIEAYARYRQLAENRNPPADIWDLVLLGDGEQRKDLENHIARLGLGRWVRLPGFQQYPDLPAYYGCAQVFIHASTTEQWGLVVNEAMASGLPVLVSNRCGCARDLVAEGRNGFTFDPSNLEELARLMLKVSADLFPLSDFGAESRRIIGRWGPDQFARGLKSAAEAALAVGPQSGSWQQKLFLAALVWQASRTHR